MTEILKAWEYDIKEITKQRHVLKVGRMIRKLCEKNMMINQLLKL